MKIFLLHTHAHTNISYSYEFFSCICLHIEESIYFLPYIVTHSEKDLLHPKNILPRFRQSNLLHFMDELVI